MTGDRILTPDLVLSHLVLLWSLLPGRQEPGASCNTREGVDTWRSEEVEDNVCTPFAGFSGGSRLAQ